MKILLALAFIIGAVTAHPCSVTVSDANCQGLNLVEVPQDLPNTITSLDLSGNKISYFGPAVFVSYPNLVTLELSGQTVPVQFSASAFTGLSAITTINAVSNTIASTPASLFFGLTTLTSVSFSITGSASEAGSFYYDGSFHACHSSCASCYGPSLAECCDATCSTCNGGSSSDCTRCYTFGLLSGGSCSLSIPANVADVNSPQLTTSYSAGFFSGFTSCWVQRGGSNYMSGFAVDDKFCCTRLGKIQSNLCYAGCPPNYDVYSTYAYVGSNNFNDKICLANCYSLP